MPRVRTVGSIDDITDEVQHEEVIYDYNSMSYKTLSQQREINRLNEELKKQSEEKKRKLKNIIGYYYKRK